MAKEEEPKKDDKAKEQPQHGKPTKAASTSIVRIAGRDIDGDLDIPNALMQIKGIGYNMSHALTLGIVEMYGIPSSTKIGSLEEDQMLQIENLLKDPRKITKIPTYLLNRRNDRETGENLHVVGTDLIVKNRQDIENDIRIQTYRGFRHRYGQKVRGQRTRSTGRTGATVGVTKKAAEAAAKPAPSGGPRGPGAAAAAPAAGAAGAAPAAAPAAAAPAAKPAGEAKK